MLECVRRPLNLEEIAMAEAATGTWHPTACILCSINCGIEIQLGPDGRRFERIRGDRAHPASQGYHCEKALRLDHYQNGRDRLTHPLRRRPDGSFERVDWDTAIREVAARLAAVRDTHGGERILYYGGGGQGNHLCGVYAGATRRALGVKYRSNALAQEKTGWAWVNEQTVGGLVGGDLERCEVALFVGKNPWHSHGVPRARALLRQIAGDPARALIVIDPRRTETAELADIHLQLRPGTDAWLLAALGGVIVQEDLTARQWLEEHAAGVEEVLEALRAVPVARYTAIAGVPEARVRQAARRLAGARSVAAFEDLGTQMTRHSTLNSYLDNLLWLLTGNFARPGANNLPLPLIPIAPSTGTRGETSPVAKAPILAGLVPCNVIAEEILTDHPDRYRAMIVESANPAHSLADSRRMRAALASLDCVVVIDVAMTETARLAHYVLPTPTQFEKWEATFFNFEFPANYFHLRRPVLDPPAGSDLLAEPEIHARLCEALGAVGEAEIAALGEAARQGRAAYATAFAAATAANPRLAELVPVILYRTLGPTLPDGAAAAAVLWNAAQRLALRHPDAVRRAGIDAPDHELGEALFARILESRSGLVFAVDLHDNAWRRMRALNGKVNLHVPELLTELRLLASEPAPEPDPFFPFVLSAGERRSFTANTVCRDPAWRKKDPAGALRLNPEDAARLGLSDGAPARVTTKRGSVTVPVELSDTMQPGHVSLPNGLGLGYPDAGGAPIVTGAAPNELTASEDRDWFAGTPWHKHVPARVEAAIG
jgi:anaerobic selenocysteine-containing dehydrogenase